MKFISLITTVLAFALPAPSLNPDSLTYDTKYDEASLPLSSLACPLDNDLVRVNYIWTTLGSLPTFPFVGGVYTVFGWESSTCGTCYEVAFGNVTVFILEVDTSTSFGSVVSEEAMNTLTGGLALALGVAEVTSTELDTSLCGL